jgi:hypothetical protein
MTTAQIKQARIQIRACFFIPTTFISAVPVDDDATGLHSNVLNAAGLEAALWPIRRSFA